MTIASRETEPSSPRAPAPREDPAARWPSPRFVVPLLVAPGVGVALSLAGHRLPAADAADALAAAITHANAGRLEALGVAPSRGRRRTGAPRAQFVARRPR